VKKQMILFVAVCLVLCLIPSVGMLFFPTTKTSENKAMAQMPKLVTEEGAFNKAFFSEFETYFTQRMALRNQMVFADAKIQTTVFQESNVSGVIRGTDGWLYYASTLDDYLGRNRMSDRELFNLAHNLSVVQAYLDARDIDFVFTIAPNKNTLYGENMPYYDSVVVDPAHNAELLKPFLEAQEVSYLDLFALFRQQDEVLYLKQDSHWGMKGACLVYNAIMDSLQLDHEDYSSVTPQPVTSTEGDLNKMLYSFYGKSETDYSYGLSVPYANNAKSVEDGWIITENAGGAGTLLMFRDSFGNTLIPFLSNEFEKAYYSKGQPHLMGLYVETFAPECVVVQKVERNIGDYLSDLPILAAPETELPLTITISQTDTTAQIEPCMNDTNYYKISGTVDPARIRNDSEILVGVDGKVYRAYHTGENGYVLYLKKTEFTDTTADLRVYVVNGDSCIQTLFTALTLPTE